MSKRILDLNTISSASNDDYLVVDGSSGTRKITPENVVGNSIAVQALTNDISNVSDDIGEMSGTIGTLQSAVENIPVVDATLSQSGQAADAKVVGDKIGNVENLNTDNKSSLVSAINEVNEHFLDGIEDAVGDWLNDHPEATTTVQDGAITEAKLADALKLKVITDYVTPEMYGAKGDGITDDSTPINAILADGKLLYLPYGKSYLCESDISTPQDGAFTICGFGTLLLNDASLVLQNYSTTQTRNLNISEVYGITVKELQQNSEKPCIRIVKGSRINVHDIMVYDGFYGIKIESGLGINIHDIRIDNSFVDSKVRTGLYIDSGDSSFSNIVIREYKIGIDEGFGSNFLYKIHCWIEDFSTVYPDSIGYKLRASRGSYTGIYSAYIDSYETPIKKTGLSFDKFYSCKILNHPSNLTKHPVFVTDYPQARISFDTLSVGYNADNYFSIPHNCIIDNICGIEGFNNLNLNQVNLASGFSGTINGRLTNAGLMINGYFSADAQVSANTPVILFNGETSGYSFALMETHLRCVNATGDAQCFLKRNYSSLVSEGTIVNGKTFYVNAFIPISNRI